MSFTSLIYIVEDDKNILEIESFALKNSGFDIRGFGCAKDFYQSPNDTLPDLILLDIMLPDEDGLNILKRLRSNKSTKFLPVIMVTAKTTEIDKVKGNKQMLEELQLDSELGQGTTITVFFKK